MPMFFHYILVKRSPKDARERLLEKKKKEKKNLTEQMIKPSLSTVYNQVSALSTNITVSSCRQLFSIGTVTSFFSPSVRICGEANLP